jgi:hypothetical protein
MEERILEAEEAFSVAEAHLAEVQTDYEKLPGATAALGRAQATVAKLYARWEELGALPEKV